MKRVLLAAAMMTALSGAAFADDIEGNWRTADGPTAGIGACGSSFCITLKSGKFAGKQIGRLKSDGGGSYSGTITDPKDDKTYSGSATVSGTKLKLTGCALKIFCKSQSWTRL
ncbi:MAG: DUF2147 domain-containing protein [Rhizobiaceae bacterium]|nr:DUF2147 domain-containing protein [Rhizobiaceae bacterium]